MYRSENLGKHAALLVLALAITQALAALPHCQAAAARWRRPPRYINFQWQLSDQGIIPVIKGVKLYDVDLDSARDAIPRLRRQVPNVYVICYISVGTFEAERQGDDRDRGKYSIQAREWSGLLGRKDARWTTERWIDIRNPRVKTIMKKRINFAKAIGCDGIEPDNTAAYAENTGFPIKKSQSLNYSRWLAATVHARGMSIGLKNSIGMLPQLHNQYDWFLNEQCSETNTCGAYSIVGKKKPVFGVEYCDARAQSNGVTLDPGCYCPGLNARGFHWLIKTTDLSARRMTCKAYCKRHSCPGRKGRSNCVAKKAVKGSVCSKVFS